MMKREEDVERRDKCIVLEEYSPQTGWSGGDPLKLIDDRKKNAVDL